MPERPGRLLVVLHGHGDDPQGLVDLVTAHVAGPRDAVVAPVGPCTAPGGPAWFPPAGEPAGTAVRPSHEVGEPPGTVDHAALTSATEALRALATTVDGASARTGVGPGATVLLGYSQGAAAALALAFATPGPAPASTVVGIAGWLADPPELVWDLARPGTRVLLLHGAGDEVVPVLAGRAAARALERHGVDVTFTELPGGHELTAGVLAPVRRWLDRALPPG